MIIIEAGLEPSGITDKETGCQIAISTSARRAFRTAWPDWAKVRNNVLNRFIAELYSNAKTTDTFTPKAGGASAAGQVGQVRVIGGGRLMGILSKQQSWVKVITVKGSTPALPTLPANLKPGSPTYSPPPDPFANMSKTVQ